MNTSMDEALTHNLIQRVNVADSLRRSASLWGRRTALIDATKAVSFVDLDRNVTRNARGCSTPGGGATLL